MIVAEKRPLKKWWTWRPVGSVHLTPPGVWFFRTCRIRLVLALINESSIPDMGDVRNPAVTTQ